MKVLGNVYRQTFPKKLRFDKASLILHAEIFMIARRHKHKKYIPKEDIYEVLNRYEKLPGSPWMQLPIVRHVFLIRQINALRCFFGKPSWLINRAVDEEFCKIKQWLLAQEKTNVNFSKGSSLDRFVQREKFVKEVLDSFHVASIYHRMICWGFILLFFLLLFIFAAVNVDFLVYIYAVHVCGMGRDEVLAWFRDISERHVVTEVPPAYKSLLPPPCVLRTLADGRGLYDLNVTELASPDGKIVVIAIPSPQIGEKSFFTALGKIAGVCDAILLEGVPFEQIDKILPAAFFPLRENTFPVLGVHHRFLDIIRSGGSGCGREPPFLYPAGLELGWRAYLLQSFVPFELRCVYWPTSFSASKGEARIGWGRLRELIERVSAQQGSDSSVTEEPYVICLPWTVYQIVNLEASLIKYGFLVRRVFSMAWMGRDQMGEHFCDYYNIQK